MKKFISPYGWFSINYPDSWFEFEDEEGSFLFYNPNRWTGNLRVSAFKDNSRNYAHQMLEEEQKNYPNAYLKNIGGWDSVITKEDFTEGGQEYTSYIYLLGKANTVLVGLHDECPSKFRAFHEAIGLDVPPEIYSKSILLAR